MHRRPNKRRIAGAVLLEWIAAAALGLLLSGLLVRLFQQTLAAQLDAASRFEVMLTAAAADRLLHDALHRRGRLPCGETPQQLNLVRDGGMTYWLNLFQQPLQIHSHDSLAAERIRRRGTAPGQRAAGSDVLVALNTRPPTTVIRHDAARARLVLQDDHGLEAGSFAVVCDDNLTVLLQITDAAAQNQVGWSGGASPGNCATQFDAQHPCAPKTPHRFSAGAKFAPLEPVTWFVGHSHGGERRSLYRERLTLIQKSGGVTAAMHREEMLEGVALLRAHRLPAAPPAHPHLEIGLVAAADAGRAQAAGVKFLLGHDVAGWLNQPHRLYLAHEISLAR